MSWPAVPVIPPIDAPPADDISEDDPPCPPDERVLTPAPPPSCVDDALPAVPPTTGDASEAEHPSDAAMVTTVREKALIGGDEIPPYVS
jgi:hypothetical protein